MNERMLIVRLGAMGDILHALPAAESLKRSYPERELVWVTRSKWAALFEGNPFIDRLVFFERHRISGLRQSYLELRSIRPGVAFDFQGLIQSALVGRMSRPSRFWGWGPRLARERVASLFYTHRVEPPGPHRLQRNLQMVQQAGATELVDTTWLPDGKPEGELPEGPFVLASPFAGWGAKQWPLSSYAALAKKLAALHYSLVLNVAPAQAACVEGIPNARVHVSSLAGLIDATRRASAVVGVDSGPLHLAAALRKPGVAIYGPTDPATHGPYGGSLAVLRAPTAVTTYKRRSEIQASMRAITAENVLQMLVNILEQQPAGATR